MTIYEYLGITPDQYEFKRDYIQNPLQKIVVRKGGGLEYEQPNWDDVKYLYVDLNKSAKELNMIMGYKIQDKVCKRFNKREYMRTPKLSKEELYDELYVKNVPMIEVARRFGYVGTVPVQNWCKHYGIEMKSPRYFDNKITKEELKRLYIDENLSAESISDMINSTKTSVLKKLKRNNISKPLDKQQLSRFILTHTDLQVKVLLNRDEFEKFIIDNGLKTKKGLMELLNLSYGRINKYLKQFDLYKYFSKDTQESRWLDSIGIPNDKKHRQVKIGYNIVDGYDESTKTIYEYYGDYWHGNPQLFKMNDMNYKIGKTFGQLYEETIQRENRLKNMGYNVVSVWEHDVDPR